MCRRIALLLGFLVALLGTTPRAFADFEPDDYCLPLAGHYCILRSTVHSHTVDSPTRQLMERADDTRLSFQVMVDDVEEVAVWNGLIIGKGKGRYFVIDSKTQQLPPTLQKIEDWKQTLSVLGVPDSLALSSPDALAAYVPDQTLRPWNYRVMHGTFGVSDDVWSLAVQILALVASFVIGFIWPGRFFRGDIIFLALATDVIALVVIGGEGATAFLALFFFPLYFCIAAILGRLVRSLIRRKNAGVATG